MNRIRIQIFWDETIVSLGDVSEDFGAYVVRSNLIRYSSLLVLLDPEDDGTRFFRNVGNKTPNGTASHR